MHVTLPLDVLAACALKQQSPPLDTRVEGSDSESTIHRLMDSMEES